MKVIFTKETSLLVQISNVREDYESIFIRKYFKYVKSKW